MNQLAVPSDVRWPGLGGEALPRLLEFNLLPSKTLHPAQVPYLAPPTGFSEATAAALPSVLEILHRAWSQSLLSGLGAMAAPVLNLGEPALPLALASPSLLQRLSRDLGIALLGAALRKIVEREEVLRVRSDLGEDGMDWALEGAAKLLPGSADAQGWVQAGWAEAADQLGCGLLAQAWHDAPAPLRERANWKLPPSSLGAKARGVSGLAAPQARAVCLQRLHQMEPTWLLCFP
ncbi:SctK family type III secretion system sorting platform protein [Ottowia thiooxydans]|uniref:Uncharacterized protein n=1 Tax=Ottowia thiooxydans TaxID=219182 RepID=A0ABV2QGE4_9BURK